MDLRLDFKFNTPNSTSASLFLHYTVLLCFNSNFIVKFKLARGAKR